VRRCLLSLVQYIHGILSVLGNNCTFGFEEDDKSADIAMSAKECIREDGRQSFVPGTFDQPFGTWCYVYYEENDCDCVAGSRLIHVGGENGSIDCQKEDVGGYRSYHFEQLDPNVSVALIRASCVTKTRLADIPAGMSY
jgi:hypothetical protein